MTPKFIILSEKEKKARWNSKIIIQSQEFPLWLGRLRILLVPTEMQVSSLASLAKLDAHRCASNLVLLWLWYKPAAAAPIQLPAQDLPHRLQVP